MAEDKALEKLKNLLDFDVAWTTDFDERILDAMNQAKELYI